MLYLSTLFIYSYQITLLNFFFFFSLFNCVGLTNLDISQFTRLRISPHKSHIRRSLIPNRNQIPRSISTTVLGARLYKGVISQRSTSISSTSKRDLTMESPPGNPWSLRMDDGKKVHE